MMTPDELRRWERAVAWLDEQDLRRGYCVISRCTKCGRSNADLHRETGKGGLWETPDGVRCADCRARKL